MSFHVGDKVRIEFDATIIDGPNSAAGRLYTYTVVQKSGTDSGASHYVYLTKDNARVTEPAKPAAPKNWPPQVGDIWKAGGIEYFIYDGLLGLAAFPVDGLDNGREAYSESRLGNDFKALNPTLIRRRSNDWAKTAADYISSHYSSMSFR